MAQRAERYDVRRESAPASASQIGQGEPRHATRSAGLIDSDRCAHNTAGCAGSARCRLAGT